MKIRLKTFDQDEYETLTNKGMEEEASIQKSSYLKEYKSPRKAAREYNFSQNQNLRDNRYLSVYGVECSKKGKKHFDRALKKL